MPLLFDERRLRQAARMSMRRRSAPGADGMTWAAYRRGMATHVRKLSVALREGSWRPGPLRTVRLTAYTGKEFAVVVPTVEDRIVHRAMRAVVEPILERRAFPDWVAGYRPGRNRLSAIRLAMRHLDRGLTAVADLDVAAVSAGASAEAVTDWLAEHVQDGTFLSRFRMVLAALPEPLAPGSGLAPLLINLRLSRVDAHLHDLAVVRFADNYCAFTATATDARLAFTRIAEALHAEGLRPQPRKSQVRLQANAEDLFLIAG
jgi:hypothetical protein